MAGRLLDRQRRVSVSWNNGKIWERGRESHMSSHLFFENSHLGWTCWKQLNSGFLTTGLKKEWREGRKEGRKEGEEGGREEEGGEKESFHFKKFLLKTTFWTVSSISQCSHLILAAWLISWFSGKLSCHLVPTWLFYRHEYAVLTKCEMAAEEVKYIILSDVLLQALHCLKDEETQWRTFPPFPIKKEREVHFFGRFSHGLKVLSQPVGRERMGMGAPPRFSVMPTQLPEAPEQRLRHDLWVLSRAWLSSTRVFEHPLVQELILTLYALSPHQSQEVVGPSIPF